MSPDLSSTTYVVKISYVTTISRLQLMAVGMSGRLGSCVAKHAALDTSRGREIVTTHHRSTVEGPVMETPSRNSSATFDRVPVTISAILVL